MTITIQSIQVGRVITAGDPDAQGVLERQWTTGFYKLPTAGNVQLKRLGLVGDAVADTTNHGGLDKAILCYAASHYTDWGSEYPDLGMRGGALGENLTLAGADETTICIGDRYQVGDCEIEVSQPRQPCWKISRRWAVKTLTKQVTQTGRTGWYMRVISEGTLQSGQRLLRLDRPNPDWPVSRANDVMFSREADRLAVFELMNLKELSNEWKRDLA
jgi:MOSC domain-containing protein YiiM